MTLNSTGPDMGVNPHLGFLLHGIYKSLPAGSFETGLLYQASRGSAEQVLFSKFVVRCGVKMRVIVVRV